MGAMESEEGQFKCSRFAGFVGWGKGLAALGLLADGVISGAGAAAQCADSLFGGRYA